MSLDKISAQLFFSIVFVNYKIAQGEKKLEKIIGGNTCFLITRSYKSEDSSSFVSQSRATSSRSTRFSTFTTLQCREIPDSCSTLP